MRVGWEVRKLGTVAKVGAGNPAPQGAEPFEGGTLPFFRMSDAGRVRFGRIYEAADQLNETAAARLKQYPSGTILFPKSGASTFLNHRVMLGVDGYVSSHLATIVADKSQLDANYLLYYLNTVAAQDLIQDQTYPSLTLRAIKDIDVTVPPLDEQRRIAEALENGFKAIRTAQRSVQANIENTTSVIDSYIEEQLELRGNAWPRRRLGDLVNRLTNGYVGPTRDIYIQSGVPYLLARHVKNNALTFDGKTFVSEEFNERNRKSILKTNDVLLVQSGHIGHSAVVPAEHAGHNCHAMIVITPKPDILSGQFLSLYFNSSLMQRRFLAIRSGSTVPHLTCKAVKELQIAVPDLGSQEELCSRIESLGTQAQRLGDLYQRKLASLESLWDVLLRYELSGTRTTEAVA